MRLTRLFGCLCGVELLLALAACNEPVAPVTPPVVTPPVVTPPTSSADSADLAAARLAWTFVENNTQPATGLVKPIYPYRFATVWDMGSTIGAIVSAHELGLVTDAAYDARIRQILATLQGAPLFAGAAFNREYDTETGAMVDRHEAASSIGYGWSATDIGRLLVWLRVLAVSQPQYAAQASGIVNRLDFSRLVAGGVLHGIDVDSTYGTTTSYAETGLGY